MPLSSPGGIEPEYAEAVGRFHASAGPAEADAALAAIRPILDAGVRTYAPGSDSPVIRSRARKIALDALGRYDPARGRLKPYLMGHLQGLRRHAARAGTAIGLPERAALDRGHLLEAERGLAERLGRDPSDGELADHTGLSARRIAHIRGFRGGFSEGQVAGFGAGADAGAEGGPLDPAVERAAGHAAAELLYDDLDGVDQLILEHTLGLRGAAVLPLGEIARRAGLSTGRISQRAAAIQAQLDELGDLGIG